MSCFSESVIASSISNSSRARSCKPRSIRVSETLSNLCHVNIHAPLWFELPVRARLVARGARWEHAATMRRRSDERGHTECARVAHDGDQRIEHDDVDEQRHTIEQRWRECAATRGAAHRGLSWSALRAWHLDRACATMLSHTFRSHLYHTPLDAPIPPHAHPVR